MKILSEIQPLLVRKFPDNWLSGRSKAYLKRQLPNYVSELNDEIFSIFCKSILSGEYVLESDIVVKEILNNLTTFAKQHFDDFGEEEDIQNILDENIKRNLVDFLETLTSYYKQFVGNISLLTTHSYLEISVNFGNNQILNYTLSSDLKDKVSLFVIYLEVQLNDHFFSDDVFVFEKISTLLIRLKKSQSPSKLKTSVREKVNFLKHKWILRQYYYSLDDESMEIKGYMLDGDIIEIFGEEEFVTQNPKLKEWSNYLDNHYGLGKHSKTNILKGVDKIKNKPLKDLTFLELHSLIKYYKDLIKNRSELKQICKHLITLSEKHNLGHYESFVIKKLVIYALNNHFSLIAENDSLEDLNEAHKEIEDYQNKYNITNYFADKKYATVMLEELSKAYKKRRFLEDLQSESQLLLKLNEILKRCKRRLDWSFRHHSLIFQMNYDDSLVPTQLTDFPGLYYASTFVLPIPKYSNTKEFQELEVEHDKLTVMINSISALKTEFLQLKKMQDNVKKTKEDLKNNDFKSLEMISIFTAIIAFIIATSTGFKFIKNFGQAIFFFSVLGGSLTLMILAIFLIRKGSNKLAKNWINIVCLIIMVTCATVFFLK